MRRCARAILVFGFSRMNLYRIYAGTIADNYDSVRLLERLGFKREGMERESSWEDDGRFHDSLMYGLRRGETARCGMYNVGFWTWRALNSVESQQYSVGSQGMINNQQSMIICHLHLASCPLHQTAKKGAAV